MGILPLQFKKGESADSLGLDGSESFTLDLNGGNIKVGQEIEVTTNNNKKFKAIVRIDTDPELGYFQNGGILHYVLRKIMKQ